MQAAFRHLAFVQGDSSVLGMALLMHVISYEVRSFADFWVCARLEDLVVTTRPERVCMRRNTLRSRLYNALGNLE